MVSFGYISKVGPTRFVGGLDIWEIKREKQRWLHCFEYEQLETWHCHLLRKDKQVWERRLRTQLWVCWVWALIRILCRHVTQAVLHTHTRALSLSPSLEFRGGSKLGVKIGSWQHETVWDHSELGHKTNRRGKVQGNFFLLKHGCYFAKLSNGPRTGKGQFSFQSQRKAMPKNVQNYCTIALISHASKVMLKILQARLQQYINRELPDVQAGFRKGRGTRDQIANIRWIMEKGREFQKNIYFCFIDYAKATDCVDHNKLWKILRDGNTRPPDLPPKKSVCRSGSNS